MLALCQWLCLCICVLLCRIHTSRLASQPAPLRVLTCKCLCASAGVLLAGSDIDPMKAQDLAHVCCLNVIETLLCDRRRVASRL